MPLLLTSKTMTMVGIVFDGSRNMRLQSIFNLQFPCPIPSPDQSTAHNPHGCPSLLPRSGAHHPSWHFYISVSMCILTLHSPPIHSLVFLTFKNYFHIMYFDLIPPLLQILPDPLHLTLCLFCTIFKTYQATKMKEKKPKSKTKISNWNQIPGVSLLLLSCSWTCIQE